MLIYAIVLISVMLLTNNARVKAFMEGFRERRGMRQAGAAEGGDGK